MEQQNNTDKYQLSKKEIKKIDKALKKVIDAKPQNLRRYLRSPYRLKRPI